MGLSRCLYLYASADNQILYIGQVGANSSSVRKRWTRSGKSLCWDFIETELGVYEHSLLVGSIFTPGEKRMTRQVLTDVETLLIYYLKPPANLAAIHTRISRPGLVVTCTGDWPVPSKTFIDQ